jgi:hypothetical protein
VGVVILRQDTPQPGLALLNRQSGSADPAHNTSGDLYPKEAFEEAIELTAGLPYSSRGPVRSPAAVVRLWGPMLPFLQNWGKTPPPRPWPR